MAITKEQRDKVYQAFVEATGLKVSKATFYRMRRELQSGETNRLTNVLNRTYQPPQERKSFKKHGDPDVVPFQSFDGEGITLEGKHKYVLLASSSGESVYRPNGLSTVECLDFLLRSKKDRRIRIFFSFGYDIQQMLIDLPNEHLVRVMHGEVVKWKSYTLQYLHGKIFSVNNVRFYDVFNYWQTSFIKAIKQTLGDNAISDSLIKGKESRSDFAEWNIEDILRYTNEELDLLVQLAEHLRQVLLRCDVHLGSAFYGPGSIANYWFKKHCIAPPKIVDPVLVDVMERGYYGGRFESFILGKVSPVYECDINSAYPAVIAGLPYLDGWEKWSGGLFDSSSTYSIWHVSWNVGTNAKIGPFPSRDKHGLISYPANGIGWYWKPEVEAALALYGANRLRIIEGYHPSVIEGEPFDWVNDVYARRLELKEQNDPAQQGLKIGLNSLYGKTAQRIGTAKYFSLAWAGYITSATRAKLLRATIGRENSVIAFATDAVYFNGPPNKANSNTLGGWSVKQWDRGYFIQSGVYRLEGSGTHKDAYRGFSVKNGIQDLIDQINQNPFKHPSIYQVKFVGHLEAIRAPSKLGPHRLCFITMRKKLQPYKTTKRRVSDRDLFSPVETDKTYRDDDYILARGSDFVQGQISNWEGKLVPGIFWSYYKPLLKEQIPTSILDNHNDHRDFTLNTRDLGEVEESFPFVRLTDRNDDLSLSESEDIAEERIGGASGIIDLAKIGNLPIVDEDEVLKELTS